MSLRLLGLVAVLGLGVLALPAPAADVGPDEKEVKEIRDNAIKFLRSKQGKDGGFSPKFGPGVTAVVVAAMAKNGYKNDDPMMKKALDYLSSKVQKNGGIYEKRLAN